MSVVTLVPYEQVPAIPLRRMLESFIAREGTDYGAVERTLDEKVNALTSQLKQREVVIVFDGESESFNLITAQQARALGLGSHTP